MKVDRVHEKFIYHPKNLTCSSQILVHRFTGSRRVRYMEVLLEHMKSRPQLRNRRPRNAMTPDKKPNTVKNFSTKFSQHVKNATPATTSSLVALVT
jgi:glycerol-3-phosphate O-acyltransferase